VQGSSAARLDVESVTRRYVTRRETWVERLTPFDVSGSSGIPLAKFLGIIPAPGIDYEIRVTIKSSGGVLLKVEHDGFPAHELRVNDNPVYRYDPRTTGAGPFSLFPPLDKQSPPIVVAPER